MPSAYDVQGTVFRNGTAILMARVVNSAGVAVTPATIVAVEYTVYELTPDDPSGLVAVTGHDGVSLTVGDVFFATLQNDETWTADSEGYNFRHEIDVSSAEAFPKAGTQYQVRYEFTPTSGQKTIVRFQLRVI